MFLYSREPQEQSCRNARTSQERAELPGWVHETKGAVENPHTRETAAVLRLLMHSWASSSLKAHKTLEQEGIFLCLFSIVLYILSGLSLCCQHISAVAAGGTPLTAT